FGKILKNLNSLTGVIGLINNDAVARIRSGNFEDGIKLYKNALESLTEDLNEYKGLITYNLALAHARNKDLKNALETLNSIEIKSNTKIYKKFKIFKVKVKMASLSGGQIDSLDNFNENKETEEIQSSHNSSDENDEKKGVSIYENILNDIEKKI
ncbi:MAG: tetratricopeptide repeat protein, partial [Silvanigrellaceae bacterium]|nr:tetratricopeptide repeat protein [Silvanigrellaceae bacterium]